MINLNELIQKVDKLNIPQTGFKLSQINNVYVGKTKEGYIALCKEVDDKNISHISQVTKYLDLQIKTECTIDDDVEKRDTQLSFLVLKSLDANLKETFLRLIISIMDDITDYNLQYYFDSIKELFSNDSYKSVQELQGFYGELYFIKYMYEKYDIDLTPFYQTKEKLKFDFSITEKKKIEVKSTKKDIRIHHFREEQLNNTLYDVKVISILLRTDDKGLTLYDLIRCCKQYFSNNFIFLIYIEKFIKNTQETTLKEIKFNEDYLDTYLNVYSSENIPQVTQHAGKGVFNIEYDSDLSNSIIYRFDDFCDWLKVEDEGRK